MRLLLCLLLSSAAMAQPRELQKLLGVGDDAYANGLYADALGAYQDAYLMSKEASLLLRIGSCYEKLQDPTAAAFSYRRYLALTSTLSAGERAGIEARIATLEARPSAPSPAPPLPALKATAPPAKKLGLRRAVAGSAAATAALALVAGGLTLGAASAYGQLGSDCRAGSGGCNDGAAARVRTLDHAADSMWALAAAGVVATVTLRIILQSRSTRTPPR